MGEGGRLAEIAAPSCGSLIVVMARGVNEIPSIDQEGSKEPFDLFISFFCTGRIVRHDQSHTHATIICCLNFDGPVCEYLDNDENIWWKIIFKLDDFPVQRDTPLLEARVRLYLWT